jgi:hypothetical protein
MFGDSIRKVKLKGVQMTKVLTASVVLAPTALTHSEGAK